MSNPKVEVALKNSCGSVGEGPHWDDASQSLLYVDIKNLDVHRYNPTTGEDQIRHLSKSVGLSSLPVCRSVFLTGLLVVRSASYLSASMMMWGFMSSDVGLTY